MSALVGFAVVVLSAEPAAVKLAAPGISSPNVDEKQLTFYTEHLAQQLVAHGLDVVTAKDINSLLSMERQKQLMGCEGESTSCMAELANALGTDAIVNGEIAKVGTGFQLNLKVIAARDGKRLAAYSARAKNEEAVVDELNAGAAALAEGVRLALRPGEVKEASPLRPVGFVAAVVGGAALVGGIAALAFSQVQLGKLTSPPMPIPIAEAEGIRDSGKLAQTAGWACVAAGAVVAAAGVGLVRLGAPGKAAARVEVGTTGASVFMRVSF